MYYTIRQVAQRTGIPASTLRFYETRGLLRRVRRDAHGVRAYSDADLDRLGTITCLKNTGMGIGEMARFMALYEQGDATLAERARAGARPAAGAGERIRAMREYKRHIDEKLEYYDPGLRLRQRGRGAPPQMLCRRRAGEEVGAG